MIVRGIFEVGKVLNYLIFCLSDKVDHGCRKEKDEAHQREDDELVLLKKICE